MSLRIPPLLEPYLALPPEASLIVLTNVLGASSNWLVLRHLYSYLRGSAAGLGSGDGSGNGETDGVVLVSFLRDGAFWKDGAGRLGLDLDAMARAGRFGFVDGLTGLFTGAGDDGRPRPPGTRVLRGAKVDDVRREVEAALGALRTTRKVLVVDQLDALLAASGEEVSSLGLQDMLLSLRERTHSTVLTLAADTPLLHAQATMLEREHASLVLSQAHAARHVLALRMLDTGVAKDVSGVVRITDGGAAADEEGGRGGGGGGDGVEFLYFVGGDGGVRVFERGA